MNIVRFYAFCSAASLVIAALAMSWAISVF